MKKIHLKRLVLFITASVFSIYLSAREPGLIENVRAHTKGLSIWWTGQNGWLIKSDTLLFATDLYLQENGRIEPCPVTADEVAKDLDIIFITHDHDDHFHGNTCQVLLEKSKCIFVLPESCLQKAKKLNIPDNRIVVSKPRQPFEMMGLKIEPMRAIHAGANFAILYDANMEDCGYLFTINGKTILQPGDSYLLQDHLRLKNVNVLFFSPTEHNTYIDASLILINELNPDYILPQHHGTVKVNETNRFWTKGYPEEVKIRLSKPMQEKYHILKQGGRVEVK